MNFGGTLRDIFTLIHEGGHSMHSWYTRQTQPFIYGDHSIFTAEVASTVNETLLIRYLMDHAENDEMLLYLVNFYIDEFKGTLFRQTMFAEFEKLTHELIESGGSLTPEWLNTEYGRLNSEYYGPEVSYDDKINYEWSRIPHFYRAFYVYQYATGYSAANAIAERILTEGPSARDEYISFLRSGSSGTPIDLLNIPKGCPFSPRCDSAMRICIKEKAQRVEINKNHVVSCWMCIKNMIDKGEISTENCIIGGDSQ
jgi:oligoendopeptidase F